MHLTKTAAVVGFVVLLVIGSVAGEGKVPPGDAESRVNWLKNHAVPLRSIDPADDDFTDLEPVRKAIGDARIVQLSEQSHGDGATFHARTRLIKFLHQKCGFDVLAFESGLYDCRKAWELLREGKLTPREAIRHGVFDIWTSSAQVQPLIEYLGQQARTPHPLEICGFDCQFSALASARYLPAELGDFLNRLPPEALSADHRAAVVQGCKRLVTPAAGIDKAQDEAFAACRKALAALPPSETVAAAELSFWRQFLESAAALAEAQPALKTRPANIERSYGNIRDPQMAKNFVWLAQSVYPRRKIIVWAAAFHLLRNQAQVAMVVEPGQTPAERKTVFPYVRIATMGHEAWKVLGKEIYSIYFTAAQGQFGSVRFDKPRTLPPLVPGSLEDLLVKAGCENVFFDVRRLDADGAWLRERLISRALGHADYEADWTQVFDGLVFTRRMYPSTSIKTSVDDVASAEKYQPRRDPVVLGVPFDRYTTRDALGRTITFYLSQPPKEAQEKLPLAVFIQGSGCASVFASREGKIYGGQQNLLRAAAQGRLRILAVEKPGVRFGVRPKEPGSAEEGSAEFRQEHTLPRWVEAVNAALNASRQLADVDWTRSLVVGHSEGGIVAAHVSAANPWVTHVALLAGGGPTQLFDLLELAWQRRQPDEPPTAAADRVRQIEEGWAKVSADPDNSEKLWLGHPYRRWSSFLKTSTLEGLLVRKTPVFLAHGTADRAVPVASFDVLRADLTARGWDVTAERLEGSDHGFRKPDEPLGSIDGFQGLLGRVVDWFLKKSISIRRETHRELELLQGTWRALAITQSGATQALNGPLANLQVVITGNERVLKGGDVVYTRAVFRINPTTKPKAIDVTVTEGSLAGKTLLGIYEIDGETHRVCLAMEDGPRPQEFASKSDSGYTLMIFKRAGTKSP